MSKKKSTPLRKGKTFIGLMIILLVIICNYFNLPIGTEKINDILLTIVGPLLTALGVTHKLDKIINAIK